MNSCPKIGRIPVGAVVFLFLFIMPTDILREKCHPVFPAVIVRLFLSLLKHFRTDMCSYKSLNFTVLSAEREKSNFNLEGSLSSCSKRWVSYTGSYSEI